MTAMPCSPDPTKSKQARMREKAEEINLVLLEPDVNLWKLRELALSEGGLVNDTIRRRAWPKLVGLTDYQHPAEDDYEVANPANSNKATNLPKPKRGASTPLKGTAPTRVTNFGVGERPSTAFTGGPFDQHDTAATGTGAGGIATSEDDNSSLASNDSAKYVFPRSLYVCVFLIAEFIYIST